MDELQESSAAWSKIIKSDTSLARFLIHARGFAVFVGLSAIFAVVTEMIRVPVQAVIVFAVIYVITLVICLRS